MSKDLTAALAALSPSYHPPREQPIARGAAPKKISAAQPLDSSSGSGGGIASPLTEASREYYLGGAQTTDGLFTFPSIKSITFTDAAGRSVIFNYAQA